MIKDKLSWEAGEVLSYPLASGKNIHLKVFGNELCLFGCFAIDDLPEICRLLGRLEEHLGSG